MKKETEGEFTWEVYAYGQDLATSTTHKHLAELEAVAEKYYELLYGVETVYPNETRHETARRYIQEQENRDMGEGQIALADLEE